jgi:hypothetical protein
MSSELLEPAPQPLATRPLRRTALPSIAASLLTAVESIGEA